ncbi:hypothetical protein PUN28_013162 [Cardiocondyla obscurior]|uniref:Uncharacterized protein n=1 Tax=Cardiocondyla obscurior TaxID=286306 RepID=A0AAW2FCV1_9HYME
MREREIGRSQKRRRWEREAERIRKERLPTLRLRTDLPGDGKETSRQDSNGTETDPDEWRADRRTDDRGSAKGALVMMQALHRQLYSECGSCLIWYRARCSPLSFAVSVCP